MEDINLDEMDWMSLAPAGYVAPEGKEHVRLEVPSAPAPVLDTSCTSKDSPLYTVVLEGNDTFGLTRVDDSVNASTKSSTVDAKVDGKVDVLEMVKHLPAQWTNAELAETIQAEIIIADKEHEQAQKQRRKEKRELVGSQAYYIKDDDAYQAMMRTLHVIEKGVKPNVEAIFKDVFGPGYKSALDSRYLQKLPGKVLKRLEWHPVVKRIYSSSNAAIGRTQYMQGRSLTLRENLASIRKMYKAALEWDNMKDLLALHSAEIAELKAAVRQCSVNPVDPSTQPSTVDVEVDKAQAKQMRAEGMSYAAIGKALGRSKQAVHKWFKQEQAA